MRRLTALLVALPVLVTPPPVRAPGADKVKVVTSLTTYGAIAREIVGDRGIVNSIATGDDFASDGAVRRERRDRKSTRLNSSHTVISYAVFCLKKKTHCPAR